MYSYLFYYLDYKWKKILHKPVNVFSIGLSEMAIRISKH